MTIWTRWRRFNATGQCHRLQVFIKHLFAGAISLKATSSRKRSKAMNSTPEKKAMCASEIAHKALSKYKFQLERKLRVEEKKGLQVGTASGWSGLLAGPDYVWQP